jgi:hypothetical protein
MARRPASILYEISKRLPFLNVKYLVFAKMTIRDIR